MTADAHSLSKLSLFYFWGAVGALAGFFLRLLMARTLTPLEYGAFYAIINFLLFLNIFNDFGLDGAFLFHYAKRRSEKEKRTVFSFYLFVKIGLALFIGAAIIIGNQWLASSYFHNVSLSRPLLALSCYFFFVSLAAIVTQYFAATGKLAYYAAMGNIRILLSFLFITGRNRR